MKLAIIDGNAMAYKSYYGTLSWFKDLTTNAVHGFRNSLYFISKSLKTNNITVTFDGPGLNFRKKIDPNYKGNRSSMPEGLAKQFPLIKDMLEERGIKHFELPGVEADDLIAKLINKKFLDKYNEIYIVTGDKDLNQLITDKVKIYKSIKNKWIIVDKEYVKNKYGIWPGQFADYLAIIGDSADNIPKGILGVGPKGAAKILQKYGTINNMLKDSNFEQHRDRLIMNIKLTTIRG